MTKSSNHNKRKRILPDIEKLRAERARARPWEWKKKNTLVFTALDAERMRRGKKNFRGMHEVRPREWGIFMISELSELERVRQRAWDREKGVRWANEASGMRDESV